MGVGRVGCGGYVAVERTVAVGAEVHTRHVTPQGYVGGEFVELADNCHPIILRAAVIDQFTAVSSRHLGGARLVRPRLALQRDRVDGGQHCLDDGDARACHDRMARRPRGVRRRPLRVLQRKVKVGHASIVLSFLQ